MHATEPGRTAGGSKVLDGTFQAMRTPLTPGREQLAPGLYEQLVSEGLAEVLAEFPPDVVEKGEIDAGEAHAEIARYIDGIVRASMSTLCGVRHHERRMRLVRRIIDAIRQEAPGAIDAHAALLDPTTRLNAIRTDALSPIGPRPDTPLAFSAILTATHRDPSLASQLRKEIAAADRVDVLCSFIKWSGLSLILDALEALAARSNEHSPRVRVISTTYMGATDPKAIERICQLPNTEVRISYDTKHTRLHAKAYMVHRATGFGSAYIGSANLSRAALLEGLEWTSKISQFELPHLWRKIEATFETYWNDPSFELFRAEDAQRLRAAVSAERATATGSGLAAPILDLRPFPFQQEILDAIEVERADLDRNRHLVVSATGTGKTMVAAFDYRAFAASGNVRPSLLFVAHRREILEQAIGKFRAVLRDQNFGDLLVGGENPRSMRHLFCSIQSYASRGLAELPADHFEYVVVDEFHHAAAPTYRRMLEHLRPRVLLGLTATPERADLQDILAHFDGEMSAEIRLGDAINRGLLVPFHYFGVTDNVDLTGVAWRRGRYDERELESLYSANDARAALVLQKVDELVTDLQSVRAVGFCVSIAHAEFMARYFERHGQAAIALTSDSPTEVRDHARRRLADGELNFIFVVDLYNEGVDIPEIDTVLFLRPTESLTIFIQQLGRGLRHSRDKEFLTVIDMIGAHRREFRFAEQFRALSTEPARPIAQQVTDMFPHLPLGCSIRLERVAQERILRNVSQQLGLRKSEIIRGIAAMAKETGRAPSIGEVVQGLDLSLDDVVRRGLWSQLLADAGCETLAAGPDEAVLAKGLRRFALIDDRRQIDFLLRRWTVAGTTIPGDESDRRRLAMAHLVLWGPRGLPPSSDEAERRLRANPRALADLIAVLRYRRAHGQTPQDDPVFDISGPLAPHSSYSRDEILAGLGHWDFDRRPEFREGVLHLPGARVDAFFVTLHKTEDAYSPTTMYEDYAISESLFHWQTQSTTSEQSETGRRYVAHRQHGYTPLLFVREERKIAPGLTTPYTFLGPADYVSHTGDRPMSIIWRLRHSIPARILRMAAQQQVG